MNKLFEKKDNILDADKLCPVKMEKVRKILKQQLSAPTYSEWDKNDEVVIMKDLSLRTLPSKYADIQSMARKLYIGYIFAKCSKVPGIDDWKEEFNEVLYEEMIE